MVRMGRKSWLGKSAAPAAMLAALTIGGQVARADANYQISEIFFNPPGTNDASTGDEYIELKGPVPLSGTLTWTNKYLLFLENEDTATNGQIEGIFDLTGVTVSTTDNGFLAFFMQGTPYSAAAGTKTYTGTTTGYGTGTNSSWQTSDKAVENSGFTALLVQTDGDVPSLGFDMDDVNDVNNGEISDDLSALGWSLLDNVGVIGEADELDSKLFGNVNFGGGALNTGAGGDIPASASYTDVADTVPGDDFTEIEWIGRQGNETADSGESWIAANLKLVGDPDEFGVAGGVSDYEAVLGRASGSGVGTHKAGGWGEDFIVTDTVGSINHTPEPSSVALASLAGLALLGLRRRKA